MVYSFILRSLFCFALEKKKWYCLYEWWQYLDLKVDPVPEGAESSPYFCFCSVHWKGVFSVAPRDSILVPVVLTVNCDIGTWAHKRWGGHQAGRASGNGVRIQNGEVVLIQDNET